MCLLSSLTGLHGFRCAASLLNWAAVLKRQSNGHEDCSCTAAHLLQHSPAMQTIKRW